MSVLARVHETVAVAQRWTRVAALAAAVASGAVILAAAALFLGGGRWLALSAVAPFVAWGVAVVVGVVVHRQLGGRWRDAATTHAVAVAAEREHGLRWGVLLGLLQIGGGGGAFVGRALQRVDAQLGPHAVAPAFVRGVTQRARGMLALLSGAIIIAVVASRLAPDGWRAMWQPIDAARGTLLAPLSWARTPTVAVRGDRLTAVIEAEGRRTVRVRWRAVGAAWRDSLVPVIDAVATMDLGVVDAPLHAIATDGRARTDTLAIEMRERPYAGDVAIRAVYPAYLGRAAETLAGDAPLRVPEGTVLAFTTRVAGITALGLRGANDSLRATIDAGRARVRVTARTPMVWAWWSSTAGADLPLPLSVDVAIDAPPVVEIVAPSRDSLISASGAVRALIAATDDHAVTSVRLRAWREDAQGVRGAERVVQLGGARGERWIGEGEVLVETLGAVAGESIVLVAEARDAAPFGRVGVSAPVRLRIPTMSERRDEAVAAADSAVREAMAAAAAQRALERRTSDAARTRQSSTPTPNAAQGGSRDGAASFEAQERAKALADAQQAMGERVQELSQRASDLATQLQAAGVMDSSVQSQLREAQRLLREAMTPELQQQLRDLDARRQQMSGDELQDALGKMQPQQQQMQEALQRSTELLKRAALEGSMQALGDEAKEVAQAQRQYADSAATPPRPGTAKELAARAEAVRQNARELADRLEKELAPEGRSGVQQAGSEAGESAREMQRAAATAEQQARTDAQRERADSAAAAARAPSQTQGQTQAAQQAAQQAQQTQRGQQTQQTQQGQQARQSQQGQQGTPGQQAGAPGMDGMKTPGGTPGTSGETPNAEARQAADRAADAMDKAAASMAAARSAQISAWKQDLTGALDASIQETLQMARQQDELSKQAQQGNTGNDVRGQQSAVQQGVQQTAERMSQQGRQSALVSPRTQQAMADAQQRVSQATQEMNGGASGSQAAQTMAQAADALRQAAASMARDRERAGNAESASGLPELMQQMQDMARQQGALNGAASQMMPGQGDASSAAAQAQAMAKLAERQRELARGLHEAADADRTGRADAMAREADQLAQALGRGQLDPSVLDRQQRLFRRMLDAGRSLEQDERDDASKREARAADPAVAAAAGGGVTRGAAGQKYREPTYEELRGLTADERRLVIEYFRRLNAGQR
jgi:hypothetical protein